MVGFTLGAPAYYYAATSGHRWRPGPILKVRGRHTLHSLVKIYRMLMSHFKTRAQNRGDICIALHSLTTPP